MVKMVQTEEFLKIPAVLRMQESYPSPVHITKTLGNINLQNQGK